MTNDSALAELKRRARGISLGLYAADLGNLRAAASDTTEWGCDILHFDEMDGVFVPAMIGGPGIVKATSGTALRDVHLMVDSPEKHVARYVNSGADMITVHAEASGSASALSRIRQEASKSDRTVLAGIGLFPGTSLESIDELIAAKPDMVLILSLDPRDGKAPDITKATRRLEEMRKRLPEAVLAFDGGVTPNTIAEIAAARPDMIVSGSAVMKADNPAQAFASMRAIWQKHQEIQ